jgi:VanZ family protein
MLRTDQRRHLLDTSGQIIKYFAMGIASFAVALILFGVLGQMSSVQFLLATCTPFLVKTLVAIVCFGFMAVLLESFS